MKLRFAVALGLSLLACEETSGARLVVAVEGEGTTSPAPGDHRYVSGARVKVTATAATGTSFMGWSGAATGLTNPLTLAVSGDQRLVAHFSAASSAGGGASGGSGGGSGSGTGGGSGGGSSVSEGGGSGGGGACAALGTSSVFLNAGGAAVDSFLSDAYFSGGSTYTTTHDIDVSGLTTCAPPPASVFQTERYGEFTYTVRRRAPGSQQTVTLYFEESYWTAAGQRTFDVAINGTAALTAFDIFDAAGGADKAVAKTFTTTADANGKVAIQFIKSGPDNPKVCAIAVSGEEAAPVDGGATGPCDLYEAGGTPCVAAHSTVRALYGAYDGKLYQVKRTSDNTTLDIGTLGPGGFADAAAQDTFCAGTRCTISILYDQSSTGNDLKSAPGGGAAHNADAEANATALKLSVGGHPAYALYVDPGVGYRNNQTSGVATGDQAQGMYMVTSGKHVNGACCFDYGNAETNNNDNGNGTMEAIYFGTCGWWGKGSGGGPWVMADLENGLFAGGDGVYDANTSVTFDYVTAMVKGKPGGYGLKVGDAQTGALTTIYEGPRPNKPGYDPMKKEGAIILGIGGDNSNGAVGTFFEGCMTSGYPSTQTDDAVQANIVQAGYGS